MKESYEQLLIGLIREQSFPLKIWKVSKFSVVFSLRETISQQCFNGGIYQRNHKLLNSWMFWNVCINYCNLGWFYPPVVSVLFVYHERFFEHPLLTYWSHSWLLLVNERPNSIMPTSCFKIFSKRSEYGWYFSCWWKMMCHYPVALLLCFSEHFLL